MVQPLWKILRRFLKKLKLKLSYEPAIPFLGIYPGKTIIQKDTHTYVHSSLFTKPRTGKQANCPLTDEWIKKCGVYKTEHYAAIKKNERCHCSNMDGPRDITLTSEKEKYMLSHICKI